MSQQDKIWWYATGDQKFGPYSAIELKAKTKSGELVSTDLIWKDGLAKWVLASSIKGLIPPTTVAITPMPPPLPTTHTKPPSSPNLEKPTTHTIDEEAIKAPQRSEQSSLSHEIPESGWWNNEWYQYVIKKYIAFTTLNNGNPESWSWNNFEWYLQAIRKYAVFDGRTGRKAYWMFFLFSFIISLIIGLVVGFVGGYFGMRSTLYNFLNIISSIYYIAVLTPCIAVAVRRMHDIGRSGWWILLPLVNIFFLCKNSQPGENEYGPNLKSASVNL